MKHYIFKYLVNFIYLWTEKLSHSKKNCLLDFQKTIRVSANTLIEGQQKRKPHFMIKASRLAQRLLKPTESIWPTAPKVSAHRIQDRSHVLKIIANIINIAFIDRFYVWRVLLVHVFGFWCRIISTIRITHFIT